MIRELRWIASAWSQGHNLPGIAREGQRVPMLARSDVHGGQAYRALGFRLEAFLAKDTEAFATTEEPYPPPKTKLQTRYRYGEWQRYYARKGWV